MPHLVIVERDLESRREPRIVVLKNHFCIGRTEPNDLVLSDVTISRKHIRFEHTERGWEVFDNGSTSGFYRDDGSRGGESQLLADGDTIQIGRYLLTFRLD